MSRTLSSFLYVLGKDLSWLDFTSRISTANGGVYEYTFGFFSLLWLAGL